MIIEEQAPKRNEQLIEEYYTMMYYTALKVVKDNHLAEDIVQESWIKVIRHNPTIQGITKLGAWLRTIVTRTAIDLIRKENTSKQYLFEEACLIEELKICSSDEMDEKINWLCTYKEMEDSLQKNKKLIDVFQLKFKQELDDHEIASRLNISIGAVKSRVFRARQIIGKQHEKSENISVNPGA